MQSLPKLKMPTPTYVVRLYPESREVLDYLSKELDESMAGIVHHSLEAYKKQIFFDKLEEDFVRLKQDSKEWDEYKKELEIWDSTLLDGLEENKSKKKKRKT